MKTTVSTVKKSLNTFLTNNPKSTVEKVEIKGSPQIIVREPWGDNTLRVNIPTTKVERTKLFRTLNKLWLPEQFTAIYHIKSKSLEVLWTAYELSKTTSDLFGRSFSFVHDKTTHECAFKDSSSDLLILAEFTLPRTAPSNTNHRNLNSFHRFAKGQNLKPIGKPISFWVTNVEQDAEAIVHLIRHLNFYIQYYDNYSPIVLIHHLEVEEDSPALNRYRHDKFPKTIRAKSLNENLLIFWNPPVGADNITKFLHSYKILEYSAHQYIEDSVRAKLQRLLSHPHALDDVNKLLEDVAANFGHHELDQHQRAKKLLREAVNSKLVWVEVEKNRAFFEEKQQFDGGFKTKKPLICEKSTVEVFENDGLLSFYERAKSIRNALSHGKDIETQGSILPTRANDKKLKPWVNLLEIIAGEIILNKNIG